MAMYEVTQNDLPFKDHYGLIYIQQTEKKVCFLMHKNTTLAQQQIGIASIITELIVHTSLCYQSTVLFVTLPDFGNLNTTVRAVFSL